MGILTVLKLVAALAVLAILLSIVICWLRDSVQAELYRRLMAQGTIVTAVAPKVTGWLLTYKEDRKMKTMPLTGNQESDAMKAALKAGVRFDKIVSLVKV